MKYILIAILLIGCKPNATLVRYANKQSFDVFCQEEKDCVERVRQSCAPHYFKIETQGPATPSGVVVTASCLNDSTVE
jgi:hypothetical protein